MLILSTAANFELRSAAWRLGHICAVGLDRRPLKLLIRELDREDPDHRFIQDAANSVVIRSRAQGNPADFKAYEAFLRACTWLRDDGDQNRDAGEAIQSFLDESGYDSAWNASAHGIPAAG